MTDAWVASNSFLMTGLATGTIVESTTMRKKPTIIAHSMRNGWCPVTAAVACIRSLAQQQGQRLGPGRRIIGELAAHSGCCGDCSRFSRAAHRHAQVLGFDDDN